MIGTFLPSCLSNFVPLGTKVAGRVNWFTNFGTVLASRGVTGAPPVVVAAPVGIFDQSGLCIDMPLRMCCGAAVCGAAGADAVPWACAVATGFSGTSNMLVVVVAVVVAV